MSNEVNILVNNVKYFRQLLNEAIGQNTIVDAINDRKYIYMYYAGDNTIMKGYRTIKPYTLGTSTKDGGLLLRAWEDAGASDSKKRYADHKGRMKYGWRLFRVDGITSFIPTGDRFSIMPDKIPPGYNPEDSQMATIIAAVQPSTISNRVDTKNLDSYDDGDMIKNKLDKPDREFANKYEKSKYFKGSSSERREATKEEIESLYGIAKKYRKKAPSKMIVVQNQHGEMTLKDIKIKDKLPPESIVGNLKDLYNKFVVEPKPIPTGFMDDIEAKTLRDIDAKR